MPRMLPRVIALGCLAAALSLAVTAYEPPPPSECGGTNSKFCDCNQRYVCEEDMDCECVDDAGCAETNCKVPRKDDAGLLEKGATEK